jgi:hypothetical protein
MTRGCRVARSPCWGRVVASVMTALLLTAVIAAVS